MWSPGRGMGAHPEPRVPADAVTKGWLEASHMLTSASNTASEPSSAVSRSYWMWGEDVAISIYFLSYLFKISIFVYALC